MTSKFGAVALGLTCAIGLATTVKADMMSSWSDGANRTAILQFVESVTTEGSDTYLDPSDRIAVFDNDGTLWTEKPTYTEVIFALDQVKALGPDHPEWQTQEPFSIILEKGLGSLREIGLKGAIKALTTVYAELGSAAFDERVSEFLNRAHLTANRPNIDTTYTPMVDLVGFLRDNGFEVFIVSGGTNAFLRTFSESAYGVPPQNVIGSALATEVVIDGDSVTLRKLPELAYFNNGETKVLNIARTIGARPTIIVGNSDGDLPMIRYALGGDGPSLALLLQHDDDAREASYDRGAGDAIAAAAPEGDNFLLISVKNDFAQVWKQ